MDDVDHRSSLRVSLTKPLIVLSLAILITEQLKLIVKDKTACDVYSSGIPIPVLHQRLAR